MSFSAAKQQLQQAVQSITWTLPDTASNVPYLSKRLSFSRVDRHQFGEIVAADQFPFCRISIPELEERRYTDGGDNGSYKQQLAPAHLFLYMQTFAKDWQAGGDYFDALVDATCAYFRNNSSPQPGGVAPTQNDHIVGWGLRMRPRIEPPEKDADALSFRATVSVYLNMFIV